ncbi:phage tail protein [Maridesulfovibrio zosterae]|uniref:phage tail-collar fiber domain-containing protein n=1 Tax=Maridesulfovibrio zosterae TaxID=82171 RepID=UPI000414BD21|nr:phage tail protein [Maridesulfovibrio zosterae]
MSSVITVAGENLIAAKQGAGQLLVIDKMIFANVPDVDPEVAVDRSSQKPAAEQIMQEYDIPAEYMAYVSPNQVVYSAVLDSNDGDYDFNWIGLYSSAADVVVAITTLPTISKFKTAGQIQGNHLTRNFMLSFDGAAESTGMTVAADTWQLDFSTRLSGLDERDRKTNRDIYGRARFWKDGFKLINTEGSYTLSSGVAYVEGIRIDLDNPFPVSGARLPKSIWLDVSLSPQGSTVVAKAVPVYGDNFEDNIQDGIKHYFVKVADVDATGKIVDRRVVDNIETDLVEYLKTLVHGHETDPDAHSELLAKLATGVPDILYPLNMAENIGETPVFTCTQFVPIFANTLQNAAQWQIDYASKDFSNPVFDSGPSAVALTSFEMPADYLQVASIYKVRVRRRLNTGQWSPWSTAVTFTTRDIFNYVDRPSNISPSSGATGVMECPKFISSQFNVVGDETDTHESTQFRVRIGDTALHLSPELGPVTEYVLPAGLLQVSSDYVWEVRHKGSALGWSEWSTATSFHTAMAFITGDEAISFTSWDGYDNASAAGVALADDAALRSNCVDQGADEGDWISLQTRLKIREQGLKVDERTSSTHLVTTDQLTAGLKVGTSEGIATLGDVAVDSIGTSGAFTTGPASGSFGSFAGAYVDLNHSLINGEQIRYGAAWLRNNHNFAMCVVRHISGQEYEIVARSLDMTIQGGPSSPTYAAIDYVVPDTGDYYLCYLSDGAVYDYYNNTGNFATLTSLEWSSPVGTTFITDSTTNACAVLSCIYGSGKISGSWLSSSDDRDDIDTQVAIKFTAEDISLGIVCFDWNLDYGSDCRTIPKLFSDNNGRPGIELWSGALIDGSVQTNAQYDYSGAPELTVGEDYWLVLVEASGRMYLTSTTDLADAGSYLTGANFETDISANGKPFYWIQYAGDKYIADISAAGFTSAPTKAHILPSLTAATNVKVGIDNWPVYESSAQHNAELFNDPYHDGVVYYFDVDDTAQLYKSVDYGATWTHIYTIDGNIFNIAFSKNAIFIANSNGYLLKSTDGGVTFNVLDCANPRGLAVSADGQHILCGKNSEIYVSNYGGAFNEKAEVATWAEHIFVLNSGRFIANGYNGNVKYSDDNGVTWTEGPKLGIIGYALVEADGFCYFAGDSNIIYRSSDNGTTWTEWFNDAETIKHIRNINVRGNYVYVAASGSSDTYGIYRIDIATKTLSAKLPDFVGTGASVVFSGDYLLFSRSNDPTEDGTGSVKRMLIQDSAVTVPAETAFTPADFAEIDVENAILGTDADLDRPDFMLLESEKITPKAPFRRVAIGVSGLPEGSETRITETQCDTWKQGA